MFEFSCSLHDVFHFLHRRQIDVLNTSFGIPFGFAEFVAPRKFLTEPRSLWLIDRMLLAKGAVTPFHKPMSKFTTIG